MGEVAQESINYVDKVVAVPEVDIQVRDVPVQLVTTQEHVTEVPQVQTVTLRRQIPQLVESVSQKVVTEVENREVPVVVPVADVVRKERIVEVPEEIIVEAVTEVRKEVIQVVEKAVPKKVVTFVQKKVEVPRVIVEERAVEVEQRFQVELNTTREVPVVQKRQVTVPKTVVQTSERVIMFRQCLLRTPWLRCLRSRWLRPPMWSQDQMCRLWRRRYQKQKSTSWRGPCKCLR